MGKVFTMKLFFVVGKILYCRSVAYLDNILGTTDPKDTVIDNKAVFKVQLASTDEARETALFKTAQSHDTCVAWIDSQLFSWKVKGPVPIHINFLIRNQDDTMEVKRHNTDRKLYEHANRRNVSRCVFHNADKQCR